MRNCRTPSVTVSDESENDRSTDGKSRRDSTCDTEIDAISRDVTDMNINTGTDAQNNLSSVNSNGVIPENDIFEPSAVANEDLLVGISFGDDWETEEEETEEDTNRDETEEGEDDVDGVDDPQSHATIKDIEAQSWEDGQVVSQLTEGNADQSQDIYEVVGMGEDGDFDSHTTGSETDCTRGNEKIPREPREEEVKNWKGHLEDPGPEYLGYPHDLRAINKALEALADNKDIMEAITANSEIDFEEKDDEEELHAINEALDTLERASSVLFAENSDIEENDDEEMPGTINERLDAQRKDGLGSCLEDAEAGSPSEADINSDNRLLEDRKAEAHTMRETIEDQGLANMIELVTSIPEDPKSKSELTSSAPNPCRDSSDRYSSSSEEGYHSERFEEGSSHLDPEALMVN